MRPDRRSSTFPVRILAQLATAEETSFIGIGGGLGVGLVLITVNLGVRNNGPTVAQ